MARLPDDLTYPAWVRHLFDHPADPLLPEWYFDLEADWWDEGADPARSVAYLTALLAEPLPVLAPYTDAQINQGLWYLLGNTQHCGLLAEARVPLADRLAAVRAIPVFYARIFLPRCMEVLGHRDEPGAAPLNSACYMWWDLISLLPAPADPDRRGVDEAVLATLVEILGQDSVACQESALHGLGHWCRGYPAQSAAIIEDYLARAPHLLSGLRAYARAAAGGCVL
jgi:hypothetical protein